MKKLYKLTPAEAEIMLASQDDPNIFAQYWFAPRSGEGPAWLFDDNFVPEGKWQNTVHMAAQTDIMVIGGFGTGKTGGIGMSACVHAAITTDFKFLNVAEKAWQAKQMYDYILQTVAGTRFEDLIWEKPRRPFPAIILRYKIGDTEVTSSLEFMSADKDATGILSWEGDWINVEEAGLLDNLEEIITSTGTRLRGSVRGRERMGRLSMISNSWDNPEMWYRFDLAASEPDDYLSMVVATRHNKNVTPAQYKKMLARVPKDEQERFMEGTRPEGRGNYFSKKSVFACEDPNFGDFAEKMVEKGEIGWYWQKNYGCGITLFAEPPQRGRIYFLLGDPGDGKAPNRNAPVIMVWDATDFPKKPARLVMFWWGDGGGTIMPFVDKLIETDKIYQPWMKGVDSTGTQKGTNELLNLQFFSDPDDLSTKKVLGLDFSGSHKMAYLIAARLMVEAQLFTWPKAISGIRSQLTNYDPLKDKPGKPKMPQDIVSVIAMTAHLLRMYFNVDITNLSGEDTEEDGEMVGEDRRYSNERRSRRSERIRPGTEVGAPGS